MAEGAGRLGSLKHTLARNEPIVRLILDGTVVRVRLDRKATSISLLVVLLRENDQKAPLAVKNMGGEMAEAWQSVLDDLIRRGLPRPELLIVDGGAEPEGRAGGHLGRRADAALHGPQASQPARQRARATAR